MQATGKEKPLEADDSAPDTLHRARERYQDILDNTNDLIQVLAPDGSFVYTNRKWQDTMGYSAEEAAKFKLTDILHPDSLACCRDRFERLSAGENLSSIDFKFIARDGRTVELHGDCGSQFSDGEIVGTRGIFRDISAVKAAEKAQKASERRYRDLFEHAPDMYFTITRDGIVRSVNWLGAQVLGYTVDELKGKSALELVHADDAEEVYNHIIAAFGDDAGDCGLEYRKLRKDGSELWVQERFRLLPCEEDRPRELQCVCRDITDSRELASKLEYQATHDPLTRLINRGEFERRLDRVIDSARKGNGTHALCYMDLDQFKIINDTCGHIAGDGLLRQLAGLIERQVRRRDTLARLGGDEFGLLMEHCDLEHAKGVAANILDLVEGFRFSWGEHTFKIGVSIGVVPINEHSHGMINVLSMADSACYVAKDTGRNRVHIHSPEDPGAANRQGEMQWAATIEAALEQDRLILHRQPIVGIGDQGLQGNWYEILLRIHVDQDEVAAAAFLPAAERYNLFPRLDTSVSGKALEWLASHPKILDQTHLCALNISGQSLVDNGLPEFVAGKIDALGIPPEKLCFELTEISVMSNMAVATDFIEAVRGLGCRFALDDFGAGLSSFTCLKRLPVDIIKIDGSFIRDVASNPIDRAMVESIVTMARAMDVRTVAEQVETLETLVVLGDIGVEYAQGFFAGSPRPVE